MRIILIRHGESEGNVDWNTYSRIGDPHVPLTDKGWMQAHDAGAFMRDWFNDPARGNRPGRWPHVWHVGANAESLDAPHWPQIYVSSFLRTRQTLSGVLTGMGDDALHGE
ncbi:MAG TPA: histidine phosphatase family protein, partial [Terriglobia bacterium]|nr:histidine phosphatase family protein [Terriglobia bacterium]